MYYYRAIFALCACLKPKRGVSHTERAPDKTVSSEPDEIVFLLPAETAVQAGIFLFLFVSRQKERRNFAIPVTLRLLIETSFGGRLGRRPNVKQVLPC